LGWVLFREGHALEAENHLRAAYEDDRGGDIAAHLGEVLWKLGKPADAEQIWAQAGAVDRENRLLKETRHRLNAEATQLPGVGQPAPAMPPTSTIRPMPTTQLTPAPAFFAVI
jgi:thioredoxin-like negative regulator of GroEL